MPPTPLSPNSNLLRNTESLQLPSHGWSCMKATEMQGSVPHPRISVAGVSLTVGSSLVAAATLRLVYPLPVAALVTGSLTLHELGHYYSASCRKAEVSAPWLVGFGVGAVGVTRVKRFQDLSARHQRYILASGPLAGVLGTLSFTPVVVIFGGKILFSVLMGVIVRELYSGTLGSDGRRRRTTAMEE
jgi:hypothetical protein